ncbi:MAG: TrbI/VirB10 family protein [Parahaliea sp.]
MSDIQDSDAIEVDERYVIQERQSRKSGLITGIVGTAIVLVGGFMIYLVLGGAEDLRKEEAEQPARITDSVPEYDLPKPPPVPKPIPKVEPKPEPAPEPVQTIVARPVALPAPRALAVPQRPIDNRMERLLSPDLGSDSKSAGASSTSSANFRQSSLDREDKYENIDLRTTKTAMVSASRLPNLTFTVPKGTPIPCGHNVAIQSDQPGMLTCTTTEDIYSADGTVILIDRGSEVTGEYRNGSMRNGKSRMFAIWDRIRTPDGAVIQIDSPATGPLGRGGIGGWIDRHYLERWGSAIMVAILYDRIDRTDNRGYNNTQDEVENLTTEFINQYANIQPTLHRFQGGELSIMVARDLDFSTVYRLTHVN